MGFSQDQAARPNIIQEMPEYQKALKFATEQKYDEALGLLQDTIKNIEGVVGENTKFHLFLYQRIASLNMI